MHDTWQGRAGGHQSIQPFFLFSTILLRLTITLLAYVHTYIPTYCKYVHFATFEPCTLSTGDTTRAYGTVSLSLLLPAALLRSVLTFRSLVVGFWGSLGSAWAACWMDGGWKWRSTELKPRISRRVGLGWLGVSRLRCRVFGVSTGVDRDYYTLLVQQCSFACP